MCRAISIPLALHLHRFGWTHQKPEPRALERDEKAIERWKRKDLPRPKKRRAAGCALSFCGRIGLFVGSPGGQDLGTPGLHSLPA
jgi:hypothetical protein